MVLRVVPIGLALLLVTFEVGQAVQKLEVDSQKLQADIARDADKDAILQDKRHIRQDKAALKIARQSARAHLVQGKPDQ